MFSKKVQKQLVKNLIARGENLCAMVCCNDWHLSYEKIKASM